MSKALEEMGLSGQDFGLQMAFKRNRDSSFDTGINEGGVMTWRNQEDGWPGTRDKPKYNKTQQKFLKKATSKNDELETMSYTKPEMVLFSQSKVWAGAKTKAKLSLSVNSSCFSWRNYWTVQNQ